MGLSDPADGAGVPPQGFADAAGVSPGAPSDAVVRPGERPAGAVDDARVLRAAARELAEVAAVVRQASVHATAALADGAVLGALPRAPGAGGRAQRALLRAVTDRRGLGLAVAGGRVGTLGARLGGMVGAGSLAVKVMTTSLRLRIAAVTLENPDLAEDPLLRRLNEAVAADREIESARALCALVRDRGAARALTAIAPVFGEILALRALLDQNPLNDATAWLIATGTRTASADPITGLSNRAIAVLDVGPGAARRIDPGPGEAGLLRSEGSLLDFLANLSAIGPTGRALVQSVLGPDGVERYVVQAPGMKMGRPDDESPGDLLGAFSSTLLDSAPYSRALVRAIEDFGVPPGAELALIGHSAGGSAIMTLAQDAGFCGRYTVTHAVAIGSPVDFKRPASPRTWVASVTNQHDIVPTLDGQGAGNCFDLHPDWYVVDYTDPTHLFPACHSIEHYTANLTDDLPEARDRIDRELAPYRGPVARSQVYRLYDRPPYPDGFPFLTVPTHRVTTADGPLELPIRCQEGGALTAYFAADAAAAAALLGEDSPGRPVHVGGRALVAVHAFDNRRTSLGAYREVHLGIVVHDPWRPNPLQVWRDLFRRADRRRSGTRFLDSALTTPAARTAAREVWGHPAHPAALHMDLTPHSARLLLATRADLRPDDDPRVGTGTGPRDDARASLGADARDDLWAGGRTGLRGDARTDLRPGVRDGLRPGVRDDFRGGDRDDLRAGVRDDLWGGARHDTRDEGRGAAGGDGRGEVRDDLWGGVRNNGRAGLREDAPDGVGGGARGDVREEVRGAGRGEVVMMLQGALGPWFPTMDRDLVVYSRRDGIDLRSCIEAWGRARAHPAPRLRLRVGPADHPMARHLRELGLDGARPLLCLTSPAHQTRRGAGVPILTA